MRFLIYSSCVHSYEIISKVPCHIKCTIENAQSQSMSNETQATGWKIEFIPFTFCGRKMQRYLFIAMRFSIVCFKFRIGRWYTISRCAVHKIQMCLSCQTSFYLFAKSVIFVYIIATTSKICCLTSRPLIATTDFQWNDAWQWNRCSALVHPHIDVQSRNFVRVIVMWCVNA